ncbi:hypothetical protein CWI36_1342p0010 [Hamiltosporidium magnivora]|uniref:Uncharacterized protein n=1 Tax=Hamiltosporidium magnivora TaxID=148818 RepID=A0A4Q9L222_9MICR|nr:hypothetical protein CWI36_1342p0010 [Hamiltosporidium magnivora]
MQCRDNFLFDDLSGIVTKYHKTYVKRLQIPINLETYILSIPLEKRKLVIKIKKALDLEQGDEVIKMVEEIIYSTITC